MNSDNNIAKKETDDLIAMLAELDQSGESHAPASVTTANDLLSGLDLEIGTEKIVEAVEEAEKTKPKKKGIDSQIIEAKKHGDIIEKAKKIAIESKAEKKTKPKRVKADSLNADDFSHLGITIEFYNDAFEKAPVKAKEKIQNLIAWWKGTAELSVYTRLSLQKLLADGQVTSGSMKIAMMSNPEKPYPVSTASSQSGQMMAALPALGIAKREGGTLLLIESSPMVKHFKLTE
ncbi:TPA: hypothetical protein ACHOZC_003396 [Raoultella ornithinolytica]